MVSPAPCCFWPWLTVLAIALLVSVVSNFIKLMLLFPKISNCLSSIVANKLRPLKPSLNCFWHSFIFCFGSRNIFCFLSIHFIVQFVACFTSEIIVNIAFSKHFGRVSQNLNHIETSFLSLPLLAKLRPPIRIWLLSVWVFEFRVFTKKRKNIFKF